MPVEEPSSKLWLIGAIGGPILIAGAIAAIGAAVFAVKKTSKAKANDELFQLEEIPR